VTRPLAVTLKRFLAPLCDLSFGIKSMFGGHDEHDPVSPQLGRRLDDSQFAQLFLDLVDQGHSQVLVLHFPSPEKDADSDLIPAFEKIDDRPHLGVEIVFTDARPETDVFHVAGLLVFARFLALLLLGVTELGIIDDLTDWRRRRGSYFDQIMPVVHGQLDGFRDRAYPQLAPIGTDHPHLRGPDLMVDF